MPVNDSSLLIDPRPQTITLRRPLPGGRNGEVIEASFDVHPDPRTCPDAYRLPNELLLALANARETINALAAQLASLLIAVGEADLETPEARERVRLALANVRTFAAGCQISAPAPSALDTIAPS